MCQPWGPVMWSECSLSPYLLMLSLLSLWSPEGCFSLSPIPGSWILIMVFCLRIIASCSSCERDWSWEWPLSSPALRTDLQCTVVESLDTNLGGGLPVLSGLLPCRLKLLSMRRSWIPWSRGLWQLCWQSQSWSQARMHGSGVAAATKGRHILLLTFSTKPISFNWEKKHEYFCC